MNVFIAQFACVVAHCSHSLPLGTGTRYTRCGAINRAKTTITTYNVITMKPCAACSFSGVRVSTRGTSQPEPARPLCSTCKNRGTTTRAARACGLFENGGMLTMPVQTEEFYVSRVRTNPAACRVMVRVGPHAHESTSAYGAPLASIQCGDQCLAPAAPDTLPPFSGVRPNPLMPETQPRHAVLQQRADRARSMEPYFSTRSIRL